MDGAVEILGDLDKKKNNSIPKHRKYKAQTSVL